jgi:hypothetical protein
MSQPPLVSIIINNYNYGHFLAAAIESALTQTYSPIEVIVVDDGSTDHSHEIIAHYQSQIVPVLKPNGGQASAFNAGFAASHGNIICFLDADDLFLPQKVTDVVQALELNVGWCFHPLQIVDKDAIPIQPVQAASGQIQDVDFRDLIEQGNLKKVTRLLPFTIPATSGLCFKRSLLSRILPMPQAENIALNDTYLQLTSFALDRGIALDQPLALQRIHGQNAFSAKSKITPQVARIHILTAYWLRQNFPRLRRLSNRLFATGLGLYWRLGGVESTSRKIVSQYLSNAPMLERSGILAKAVYRIVRLPE